MLVRLPFVRRLLVRSARWRDAPEFAVALAVLAAVCAAGAHGLWALARLALGPSLPVPALDPGLGAVWGVWAAFVAVVVLRTGPWRPPREVGLGALDRAELVGRGRRDGAAPDPSCADPGERERGGGRP